MKHICTIFILPLILIGCASQPSEFVDIPDESLAKFIRNKLDLDEFEPIPEDHLKQLTELTIRRTEPKVKNIKGLEYATGLKSFLCKYL